MEINFEVPPSKVGSRVLFSAKSYFIDRFTACVEEIRLPEYRQPIGTVNAVFREEGISRSKLLSRKKKAVLAIGGRRSPISIQNRVVIDFRCDSPGNWSHSLNFHIPFAFYLKDVFSNVLQTKQALFLLPGNTPKYIAELFELFELEVEYTDRHVRGSCIDFSISPFDCLRGIARVWVQKYIMPKKAYTDIKNRVDFEGRNIFISRKDTRKITNEKEVADFLLSNYGYEKVYAEDFSVSEQIAIFMHSNSIAAIHGAAIGPVLYRPITSKKMGLLEIFSPGHMTNFYRGTAEQCGVNWVGIRGRLESKHIKDAYRFDRAYLKYSLSDFFVDIQSLERAANLLSEELA